MSLTIYLLALYSQDTARKLKMERDFNKERVDTIQALMVSIHPCGTIASFNRRAEEVTGYGEKDEQVTEKILAALNTAGGNKAKAARLLNIDRSTLYRKMRELHIDVDIFG